MSIVITSLSPNKNETDVSVNSDIDITIESDTNELDINTVEFYINGIEVRPSAYYGATKKIVDIHFYSKKRIKYNTRRYHEENTPGPRYGERDIHPSIFQYGYRYTGTIKIRDVLNNLFEENFSFTIEDGIFYNLNPETLYYYDQSQALANYTPEWAQSRYNKFSNFQQFINPSMKYLSKIDSSLQSQLSSYFVQTSDLTELSTLYKIELGDDYSFSATVLDDGTSLQIPPDIAAFDGVTKLYPNAEFNNNINSFYYDKIPSRLDEEKEKIDSLTILSERLVTNNVLTLNKKLTRHGPIVLTVKESQGMVQLEHGEASITSCRITGVSRENKDQIEDILLIGNGIYPTRKLWKKIDTIQFFNIKDDFLFSIDHAIQNNDFIPDVFTHISFDDIQKTVFWKLENTIYGSVLQKWVTLGDDIESIISSSKELDIISEEELLDIDNQTNLNLNIIATGEKEKYIYGTDDAYLYLFKKEDEYPKIIKNLNPNSSLARMVIDLDAKELGRGNGAKTISIKCLQKSIKTSIALFRLSVVRPDGRVDYIAMDNSISQNKEDADTTIDPNELQYISPTLFYEMDIAGDYIVQLESIYRDGSVDYDTKIARIKTKSALVKYKLERLLDGKHITRFFVDFDQRLKILDEENELHSIRWVRDNMLVDYSNAIVYFNEDYDSVELV